MQPLKFWSNLHFSNLFNNTREGGKKKRKKLEKERKTERRKERKKIFKDKSKKSVGRRKISFEIKIWSFPIERWMTNKSFETIETKDE